MQATAPSAVAHHLQMMAIIDIVLSVRTEDGQLRYLPGREEADLQALAAILRHGQNASEFRSFDLRVMAGSIRGAIDAVARLLVAEPNLNGEAYARELVRLFDRATRTG